LPFCFDDRCNDHNSPFTRTVCFSLVSTPVPIFHDRRLYVGTTVPVFDDRRWPDVGTTVPVFDDRRRPDVGTTVPVFHDRRPNV